nr:HAMP domain-containing protein [Curtobacterium flaccumfaciens]
MTFALAAMALAAGVVVFSNVMSLAGVGAGLDTAAFRTAVPTPDFTPATRARVDGGAAGTPSVAVVQLVAVQQWQWSAIGVAVAGVAAGGIGWVLSRRMLHPIDRITATANRISASNLHERIALDGPDDEPGDCPGPSTTCSTGWRPPSPASGASWRRPRTSSAPRSPSSVQRCRSG